MSAVLAASSAPSVFAAVGAGMLSFLSPCVLPLVPGYLSLMSGMSTSEVESAAPAKRGRLLGLSLMFVVGFSIVFVAYGAVASSLGTLVAEHRLLLTRISGAVMIVMGLVVAGALQWKLLARTRRFQVSPAQWGPYAAPMMGMAFAFGWTPCVGPILAAVLALAAAQETLASGVWLLVAYSAGLGVPFVASAVGLARARSAFGWFRRHSRAIDIVSGVLLAGFGVLVLMDQLGRLSGYVIRFWTFVGLDRLTVG